MDGVKLIKVKAGVYKCTIKDRDLLILSDQVFSKKCWRICNTDHTTYECGRYYTLKDVVDSLEKQFNINQPEPYFHLKIVYHTRYANATGSMNWLNTDCMPECKYEEKIKKKVEEIKALKWQAEYHTYSSLVVNIFRLLIVEGTLDKDNIEFYADDVPVKVNEYGASDNNNDKSRWLDVENNVCERILRLASNKRKENRK